jgi:hypothetical protein
MYPNKLDQLDPERRAVIAWFYSLSNPPSEPEAFPDQARRGMSCFLMYVARIAAHEPGMLSALPGRSYEEAQAILGHENALFRHVVEGVTQKVLLDKAHGPETHRYTTPLLWPPVPEGEPPAEMPRLTLYKHTVFLLFGGVEGIRDELSRTWKLAKIEMEIAIRWHFGQRGKRRGRKA